MVSSERDTNGIRIAFRGAILNCVGRYIRKKKECSALRLILTALHTASEVHSSGVFFNGTGSVKNL
jgi:hypothetical protein